MGSPFASRLHPGDRGFERLPGAIVRPVLLAHNVQYAVGSHFPALDIDAMPIPNPPDPGVQVYPSAFESAPFYQSMPMVMLALYVISGGNVEVKIRQRNIVATGFNWKLYFIGPVSATNRDKTIPSPLFTRYMSVEIIVTNNPANIDLDVCLLYGYGGN